MLDSIRQGVSSWTIKILLGLLILSFAVWGIGDIFVGAGANPSVATVGDEEISADQFMRAYYRDLNQLSGRLGRQVTPDEGRDFGLVNQTLSRIVVQTLLSETAKDYGLSIGDEVLREAVWSNEAFQDATGRFDRNRFLQTLGQNGLNEEEFIATMRRDLARDQLLSSISVGAFAPAPMIEPIFQHRREQRVAELAVVGIASVDAPSEPDEPTLKRYHEENEARYMAPEYRAVTYVWIPPDALYDEIEITEDELQRTYESRQDDYFVPETRELEQLIYASEEEALAARARLVAGESFDTVAEATDAFNVGATDLGRVTWNDLPEELGNRVFELDEGTVSEPLQSPFGYHVVRVSGISPEATRPLAEVRGEIEDEIRRRRAYDGLGDLVARLEDEMAAGRTLEEAARRVDLTAETIPAIDRAGNDGDANPIDGIPDMERFIDTVFSSEAGVVTDPQDSEDGGFFVARVDEVSPEAVRPLADIREVVAEDWVRDHKLAEARKQAEALMQAAKSGKTFEEAAREAGTSVSKTRPLTRAGGRSQPEVSGELVDQLFSIEVGAYALAETADHEGFAVARLDEVLPAAPATNDVAFAQLRDNLNASVAQDILVQYQVALQNDVGINVNQSRIETMDLNALPAARGGSSGLPIGGLGF